MISIWGRWLAVALMTIGLGVAGLELAVCVAAEEHTAPRSVGAPAATDPSTARSASGAVIDETEPSAPPRLTS